MTAEQLTTEYCPRVPENKGRDELARDTFRFGMLIGLQEAMRQLLRDQSEGPCWTADRIKELGGKVPETGDDR